MLNIEIPKVRPEARRAEVIEWRSGDAVREKTPASDRSGADASPASEAEHRWFAMSVAPWLTPNACVLEIGPGNGKWTLHMAPLVRELVVVDVAETTLERTRTRLQAGEIRNVSYVLGSGRDLHSLPSDRFDVVVGDDVFARMPVEDTVAYLGDIARVLRDGGLAVLHRVSNDVPVSREALDRMFARFGLRLESVWTDDRATVVTARRPADSIVPGLEQALRLAAAADDDRALDDAMRAVTALGQELNDRLAPLATLLLATSPGPDRFEVIQRIRRLFRG